jgi:hypothetical protein
MAVGRKSDGRIERRSAKVRATPKTADRERDDYIKQVREGTCKPWKKRQAPPKRVAVADLWPIYLRNYMNMGKTCAGRLEIAWNHLKPKFATVAVDDLSTALIEVYIEARRTDGVKNATVNLRNDVTLRGRSRPLRPSPCQRSSAGRSPGCHRGSRSRAKVPPARSSRQSSSSHPRLAMA